MYEYNLQIWPSSKNPVIQLYVHETPLTLSCNLKSTRQALHLTRKAVADSIGISVSTLADYENGHATSSFRVLVQLAKLYHSSTDYLRDLSEKTSAPLWKRKCAGQALSISRGGSVLNVNHWSVIIINQQADRRKLYKIGIVFSTEKRNIADWKIQEN